MLAAATGRMAIVRMAEIVAGAAVDRAAEEDAAVAGAAEGPAVEADEIVDVAGQVGGDTKNFSQDFHGSHG